MATVGQLERLFRRVGKVLTIDAHAPIVAAAEVMTDKEVGCLIVLDTGRIVGICSERDIVRGLAAGGADAATTPVRRWMTSNVISCDLDTPIGKVRRMMAAHGIRHIPVIVEDVAVGMVSSRDVMAYRLYETSSRLAEAKRDARAADEAKAEFLSNVSYEVRTPMTGIIGMTELMLETALTDEQRDSLGIVKESAESLLAMITNILDFSELAAGRVELNAVEFVLRDAMDEQVHSHRSAAESKGLALRCLVAPDVPRSLVGDPDRFRGILSCLISNAVKFTEAGGVIAQAEVESRSDDEILVHFAVTDTGVGIPPERKEHLFDAFTSGARPDAKGAKGACLGLAMAAKLVDLMGGRLWADSVVDRGSTFHFVIPFAPCQAPAEAELQPAL